MVTGCCSECSFHLLLFSQLCLQVFQLLPGQVAPLVCTKEGVNTSVNDILEFLMNVILGEVGACGHSYIFGKNYFQIV